MNDGITKIERQQVADFPRWILDVCDGSVQTSRVDKNSKWSVVACNHRPN